MADLSSQTIYEAILIELHARITGESIPEYTLPDGRSVRKIESSELRQLAESFRRLAQEDALTTSGGGGGGKAYIQWGRPT